MSIASASTTVKFHEFPTGSVVHNYQPGTQIDGPIRSISWSKDGNWLALVPHSGSAEIVSVKDQLKLIHTIQGIEEPTCASFQNTTKKYVAIGTKSGQVLIYDIKARSVKKRFPRTTSAVTRVEFTAKDSHVVAACESGEAFLYSNLTNNLSGTFKVPRSQTIGPLKTNPIKRNYVVAGSDEGVVAVWDIHGNKNKFFMGSHKAAVTGVAFSPVSCEVVISTGLDRQFCIYDIGANKCVGNVFVENNMASVDFFPDGKYIVMASQKGTIYVYDLKNYKQPLHSFFGHNTSVDHLAVRKTEEYEASFSIPLEDVKESELASTKSNENSFSLNVMLYNEKEKSQSVNLANNNENDTVDSFMEAMGLDQQMTEPSKQDFSLKKSESARNFVSYKCTPITSNPTKILQERFNFESKTSTPIYAEGVSLISPGMNQINIPSLNEKTIDVANVKHIVEEFKDELKVFAQEIKNEMKYYSTHVLSESRQMYLNLLMSMVKESLKVENHLNGLRADLLSDEPQNQESLFEENFMLKQRIAALEQEISILKNNQANKDM